MYSFDFIKIIALFALLGISRVQATNSLPHCDTLVTNAFEGESPSNAPDPFDVAELYKRYQKVLLSIVYADSNNTAVAEDVVAECFLRLIKQTKSGALIDKPEAWLCRVAKNLLKDRRKSHFVRYGTSSPTALGWIESGEPEPLVSVIKQEAASIVRDVLGELSNDDSDILVRRYYSDENANESAEALKINLGAASMRVSRARGRFEEQYRKRLASFDSGDKL